MGPSRAAAVIGVALAAFLAPASAGAAGGSYAFDGGSAREQAQVRAALDASAFDWDVIGRSVTVHIGPGFRASATPGHVWLDGGLLRAGTFSWAIVQDEFAHQVDFFLFDALERRVLNDELGGLVWCHADRPGLPHSAYGCERFTSTLVWAFWPAPENAYQPQRPGDESAAMSPARFRELVGALLGVSRPALRERRVDSV